MHTPQLLKWGVHDITILVEKPVAVSEKQVLALKAAHPNFRANICVGMEYRFIPAINKLLQLIPSVGTIKKISIRENRYPFLSKIAEWNKDVEKSGDTLVEKCCHFFDLFRLISGQEMTWCVSKGMYFVLSLVVLYSFKANLKLTCFSQFTEDSSGITTDTTTKSIRRMSFQSLTVHTCCSTLTITRTL